jgi:hypothetical protein
MHLTTREFFAMLEEEKQVYNLDYEKGSFQGYKSSLVSSHITRNLYSWLEYMLQPQSLRIKDKHLSHTYFIQVQFPHTFTLNST